MQDQHIDLRCAKHSSQVAALAKAALHGQKGSFTLSFIFVSYTDPQDITMWLSQVPITDRPLTCAHRERPQSSGLQDGAGMEQRMGDFLPNKWPSRSRIRADNGWPDCTVLAFTLGGASLMKTSLPHTRLRMPVMLRAEAGDPDASLQTRP